MDREKQRLLVTLRPSDLTVSNIRISNHCIDNIHMSFIVATIKNGTQC